MRFAEFNQANLTKVFNLSMKASLIDFSLPEVFQFIEKGKKSGLLSFDTSEPHYIWMEYGRIVAAANRLDHQGLVSLIERYHWVSERVFDKLVHWCCPLDEPLGLWLKNQGVLKPKQVKQLFLAQILPSMCFLFQLKDAQFKFESNVPIPAREMTGLSVPATKATLIWYRINAFKQEDASPSKNLSAGSQKILNRCIYV